MSKKQILLKNSDTKCFEGIASFPISSHPNDFKVFNLKKVK